MKIEWSNVTRYSKLGVAFALVATAGLIFYVLAVEINRGTQETPAAGSWRGDAVTVVEGDTVRSRLKNFSLRIAPGWQTIAPDEVTLPENLQNPYFALHNNGTECTLAYIHTPLSSIREEYRQIYNGGFVYTADNDQLSGWWYAPVRDLPEDFQTSFGLGPSRAGEVRIEWYPSIYNSFVPDFANVFILFSRDGGIVPKECDADVSTMLASISRVFESTTLTPQSEGIAYILRENNLPAQLMFVAEGDTIHKKVMALKDAAYSPSPVVYDNKVVFVENRTLQELDVFSGTITKIPGIVTAPEEIVNDFVITGDRLFYLSGRDCADNCSLELYEYSFETKEATLIVGGVTSPRIVGYDKSKNTLGMRFLTGDAGCYSRRAEEYDFSSGELSKHGEVSGCDGDPNVSSEPKEEEKKYVEFDTRYGPFAMPVYDSMTISEGEIVTPSEPFPYGDVMKVRFAN